MMALPALEDLTKAELLRVITRSGAIIHQLTIINARLETLDEELARARDDADAAFEAYVIQSRSALRDDPPLIDAHLKASRAALLKYEKADRRVGLIAARRDEMRTLQNALLKAEIAYA